LPSEQHYLKWVVVFLLVQFAMVSIEIKRLLSWDGDSALWAHYYLNFVKKVTMLKFEVKNLGSLKTENITILMNHDTVEVLGDEQVVTGVKALNQNYK
jgi:thioredoxin reductase (NADPH)